MIVLPVVGPHFQRGFARAGNAEPCFLPHFRSSPYVRRPPRTLTYALSPKQGLYVGEQLYSFDSFKAFGLIQDGEHHSIMLIPRKRFAPGVSVYFPEDAGERIVDILGQRLPMGNRP